MSFIIGGKKITVAGNGDIISISEDEYKSYAPTGDVIITGYNNVSVDDNRDVSVWKGNYFPSVFYFPIDKHLLIRDYRNNSIMLAALDEIVRTRQMVQNIDTIEIIGACSPTGSEEHNLKLALSRCMALRSYLRWKHLEFAESFPIRFNIIGVDRLGYRILKEQELGLSEKQIGDMLQYAAIRLKMKDGSYIIPGSDKHKTFFNPTPSKTEPAGNSRHTAGNTLVNTLVYPATESKSAVAEPYPTPVRDTVFLKSDTIIIYEKLIEEIPSGATGNAPAYVALKTNLLYDAALLPNLSVEWYMGKNWSLVVEGNWSWWTFDRPIQNEWYHRIQAGGVELRKWVKSSYPLHGHALGVYSLAGNYDVRLFTEDEYSKGWLSYQSWSAGVSYAYSFPIARRLNLELGLAVGYAGGRYYRYDYCLTHDHWAQRAAFNRNYIGPTRLGVSLVWLLGAGNDEKSRNLYLSRKHKKSQPLYGLQK
ncbi:MAG: DUF3575 domain-containing protein [Dysgonamonadaceae bacterium]|nr:DUF3575 domain-containing protein [Dysgonamonadaceae bacterium]